MSKKSLLDGLESLFLDDGNNLKDENPLIARKKRPQKNGSTESSKKKTSSKKSSSNKDFKSSLSNLFEDEAKLTSKTQTQKSTKQLRGLDLLIRSTIQDDSITKAEKVKRLTLTLEQKKIAELKKRAKEEKKLVSQIVSELVDHYFAQVKN